MVAKAPPFSHPRVRYMENKDYDDALKLMKNTKLVCGGAVVVLYLNVKSIFLTENFLLKINVYICTMYIDNLFEIAKRIF